MEHLAVYAFASGTFMPMICIVALPVTAKEHGRQARRTPFCIFSQTALSMQYADPPEQASVTVWLALREQTPVWYRHGSTSNYHSHDRRCFPR